MQDSRGGMVSWPYIQLHTQKRFYGCFTRRNDIMAIFSYTKKVFMEVSRDGMSSRPYSAKHGVASSRYYTMPYSLGPEIPSLKPFPLNSVYSAGHTSHHYNVVFNLSELGSEHRSLPHVRTWQRDATQNGKIRKKMPPLFDCHRR